MNNLASGTTRRRPAVLRQSQRRGREPQRGLVKGEGAITWNPPMLSSSHIRSLRAFVTLDRRQGTFLKQEHQVRLAPVAIEVSGFVCLQGLSSAFRVGSIKMASFPHEILKMYPCSASPSSSHSSANQ